MKNKEIFYLWKKQNDNLKLMKDALLKIIIKKTNQKRSEQK